MTESPPPLTRRCTATGRELKAGEKFYSVLRDDGGKFVRTDYAADAWTGPPQGAYSYWSGRVAADGAAKRPAVDDELLLECLGRLAETADPAKVRFRYVVALLLMRRRRLKFEDARKDAGGETLVLKCARTGSRFEVVDPGLSESEAAAVQDEVFQVLGWG
jgi:hypothetical protein